MPKPFPDNPPNRPVGVTLPGEEENPIVVTIGPHTPFAPELVVEDDTQTDIETVSVTEPTPDRHSPVEDTASATTTDASTERGALRAK